MSELTIWEADQCECGNDIYFIQDEILPEGHIWEDDQEMFCSDEKCKLVTHVNFNDDGSSYSISWNPEEKQG